MRHLILVLFLALPVTSCLSQVARSEWPPELTEIWEPEPPVVTPGAPGQPPSDAVILFDGSGLGAWESVSAGDAPWTVADGTITVRPGSGDIRTRQEFGDIQLHLEFRTPSVVQGKGQGRGNSGVFFQERYEVQILDSYQNRTYSNGQLGSVYKQHVPLANPARPPGQWQAYDIFYTAPVFDRDGGLVRPAYVTVMLNGVLIQNHVEIRGTTEYRGLPNYTAHGPGALRLQDHGNLTSFRNIWVREL